MFLKSTLNTIRAISHLFLNSYLNFKCKIWNNFEAVITLDIINRLEGLETHSENKSLSELQYIFTARKYICRVHEYIFRVHQYICGPGSSVGIPTDYGLDGRGSNPGGDEIFHPSRAALGPT